MKMIGGWNPDSLVMFDPETPAGNAGGEQGGAAQGSQSGGNGGNQGSTQQPNPGVVGGQGGNQGGGNQGGGPNFSYREDRSNWVPPSRIKELSDQIKTLKQQTDEHNGFRTRLGQAFGVNAPSDADREVAEAREALFKVFPNLKVLEKLDPEKFDQLMSGVETAQSSAQAQWDRHANQMIAGLETEVASNLGVEKLTPTQAKNLTRAFREEARDCAIARQRAAKSGDASYDASNDFIARYERGDATLLKEFAKAFLGDWVEPGRRMGAADVTRRQTRPVPRGERSRQAIAQGPPQIDYNNADAFKKALLDARGGGQ
jgi:hypothetical protein